MQRLCLVSVALFAIHQQYLQLRVEGGCPTNENNEKQNWHFAVFQNKEKGKALKNHVFHSRIVRSEIECSLTCLRHAQCQSFNYQDNNVGARHLCELSDQSRLTRSHDLLQRNGFSYYGSELKPCLHVICQHGGTCNPVFDSMVSPYCCQCEQRYTGQHCQHLKGFRFTNSSSGDHATVPVGGNIEMTSLTVCLRFKASHVEYGISTLVSYVTGDFTAALQLHVNRTIRIYIKDQYSDFPYVSLLDDTWHLVCFTWKTIGGNLSLYSDGLLIGQKQSVHPGLSFNSTGSLVIGQLQKTIGGQFYLNESFLGDITDVNIWKDVLTQSAVEEQSRVCYGQEGDLLDWSAFSNGSLQFHKETNSIPSECSGFDPPTNYDLEFPRRTNEDYVFGPTLPSLSALTVSLFVSLTDDGDKTFFNYFAKGALNEIFIHERRKLFTVRIRGVARQENFHIAPDGLWHHIVVTWENINGTYEVFVNGESMARGEGLENGTTITAGGNVVLGNDRDHSGFQVRDAFVGNISRVNLWDYVLPRETIALLSQRCGKENGEIVAWRDFRAGPSHGVVNIREPSSCKRP
ncbi:hypothetical protein ACROYT_G032707 [Oculina patagonica]